MTPEIVGRDQELERLHAFIDDVREGPSALVLEGEAGIGKSALWLAAVEHARTRAVRVLEARPAEAERSLAHVGLGDLLRNTLDVLLPALPAPRRRALEVALLLEDAGADTVDAPALATATLSALQVLAGDSRVLVAIDDLQWFDASSARALAFAFRRLDASDVHGLLARRLDDGAERSAIEQAFSAETVHRLSLGPLSLGALHRFLRDRLGSPLAHQTLLRIYDQSGGNPFHALELARVLDSGGDPAHALPVPPTLDDLVRARISGLPARTRKALALAAALGTTSDRLLEQAGVEPDALSPALAAHVIEREGGAVRFTHPLLPSILYQDLGEERRNVHRRLAEVIEDPLIHAHHLALSRGTPDAEVADALDAATGLAADRGASAAAAELAEQALRLTPPDRTGERHRRALAAGRAQHAAGEWTRARTIANDLLAEMNAGSVRADALVLLAEVESVDRAAELLYDALGEADSRPALQSEILCRLAWATRFRNGYVHALQHARDALRLAEELGDEILVARAHLVQAILGWIVGDADAPELPGWTDDFATPLGGERLVQEAALAIVNTSAPSPRRERARDVLEREHREWRERDEPRSARALWGLSWLEFFAGRWTLAAEYAAQAHDISIQYGLEVPQDHLPIALVAVHRGQRDLARKHSEQALVLAETQLGLHPPQHMAILGLVARGSGDPATALAWLDKADRQAAALGWGEPSIRWWSADHIELLLELGQFADAVRVLDIWDADATRLGREWVLAQVARCRGLVAAARGDVEGALPLLEAAVARHEAVGDPFGRGRALLALGIVRRRGRLKRSARESLGAALAAFEAIGATEWATRARAELGRIGGRARQEGLTAAERRVAALVAQGQTNREVAAALFLGERTVGSHLTHIYAKLGVRSRTELARNLRSDHPT